MRRSWISGMCLLLLLAASTPAQAAVPCPLWLWRVGAYFHPISLGPAATFEVIKGDIDRKLRQLERSRRDTYDALELAALVEQVVERRIADLTPYRKVRILAQLIGAAYVDSRTDIVGWLDHGPRGEMLRALSAAGLVRGDFRTAVRANAVGRLVALDTFEGWKELAWSPTADAGVRWRPMVEVILTGHPSPHRPRAFAEALKALQYAERVAGGDADALFATRPRGDPAIAKARALADRIAGAIAIVDPQSR